jgi:phosphohistidine swiveling domain-containing protein
VEELRRGVGTLAREQREQEVTGLDPAAPGRAGLLDRALEDGTCPGGERRESASASGALHGAEVAGVDADGGERRSIEGVLGGAGRRQVDAERPGGFGSRVVEDAEEEMVGAEAAVAKPTRLAGGRLQQQPPRILAEPPDHRLPRRPSYFACTDWRETPSASPICSDESEFGRLRPGDVLVCPITSPVWSVLFPSVGALVTDTGGLLSHPAIIAREYRLPAVVATGNATALLRDDQVVTVDGGAGRIEVQH